jgi:hypothetical protein
MQHYKMNECKIGGVYLDKKKQPNTTVHRSAIDEHIQFPPNTEKVDGADTKKDGY